MVDITERLRLNATDWIFGDTATTAMKEILSLRQRVQELEQQLTEVRRAERELVAQYVQQGTGDWMLGKKIAEAIRAMEDE